MSKLANLKKKAADLEQRRLFDKALAVYEEVLQEQEGADEADVGLFNRVGDLHLRQGNVEAALKRYEQAVDLYVERGFQNNAVALCNKILRQDPSRAEIHFRLGQISCSKGFRTEARRHFQEYVAQLNRAGSLERAITTLRDFADENDDLDDVRQMFADILVTHGRLGDAVTELVRLHDQFESEQRHGEAQAILGRILELDPDFQVGHAAMPGDAHELEEGGAAGGDGPAARHPHHHRTPTVPDLVLFEPTGLPAAPPTHGSSRHPGDHRDPTSTGLALDAASALGMEAAHGRDDGVRTAAERLGDSLDGAQPVELADGLILGAEFGGMSDAPSPSLEPLDLEPTAFDSVELDAAALDDGLLDLDTPALAGIDGDHDAPGTGASDSLATSSAGPPAEEIVLSAAWDVDGGAWEIPEEADDDPRPSDAFELAFPPVIDDDAAAATADDGTGALDRQDTIDGRPDLSGVHPDVHGVHDADESFVVFTDDASADPGATGEVVENTGRYEDDPGDDAGDSSDTLVFLSDGISDLADVASADASAIDVAAADVAAADVAADGGPAEDDVALAHDQPTAAEAATHPPAAAAAAPVAPAMRPASPAAREEPPAPAEDASFVNLGDWLREDDEPRSTRMVTEERAPTGDEDADFAEMLRKFKQGVADNVDDNDYASHYDLGVAFREMGLVDEAIAAFQRALRGTVQRVRAFEALGQCFLDKEQFAVAASVLQRALQEPGADDERLVGVLYLLGRAAEAQNQRTDALRYYQRVFAVDIEFGDVADRIGAVERVPL